ncbi:hypothetical protein [Rubellicoccus peritrichatus]|uniref:Ig-like domain-containing protein n=1 Tax=Rubellicoccus peritrichatus TaxID=3080537 RepID=A0AAQ3LG87_9BACT|nr:hypothetical protein [Puniceicoccus sp. CR14]WOO43273.1 hypothetical protein RZN69_09240 [Puniceicoccus sp. CR14]
MTLKKTLIATSMVFAVLAASAAERTFVPIEINTIGNPRGYYEFLPSAYHENPTQDYPVVIFLHGLGETGDGLLAAPGVGPNGKLQDVLQNGPPDILDSPGHPLYDLFEQNDMIVLSPQYTTWWSQGPIREFLDFVLTHYRIDERRIYLTGLSAGSSGLHSFMNTDSHADQVTAFVACAVRGKVKLAEGDYLGKRAPYWTLVRVDAGGNERGLSEESVNNLAGFNLGTAPTDVRASYPGNKTVTHTASFDPVLGTWAWESDVPVNADKNIRVTLFPGTSHNSWGITYNNANMWSWLFAQQKPDVTITSPSANTLIVEGDSLSLQATAADKNSTAITGSDISWESDLDGFLGTGATLTAQNLSRGVHTISCSATDTSYRLGRESVTVTVVYDDAFTAQIDVGSSSYLSPGWNDLTDRRIGYPGSIIENAVSTNSISTAIRLEVTDAFFGIRTDGELANNVYPENVQRDNFYIDSSNDYGEITVSGLNPAQDYDFTFFASRAASGVRPAKYTVNGLTATLEASDNTSNTATIANVSPDAQGQAIISVERDNHTGHAYLGSIVIVSDGSASGNATPQVNAGIDIATTLNAATAVASLSGTASDDGLPSNTLTTLWQVTDSPAGSTPVIANASALQTSLTVDTAGTYILQLTADDSEKIGSDTVIVTVSFPNTAPTVMAGSDQSLQIPNGGTITATLSGVVMDDGLPASTLTTLWEITDSPAGSTPIIADASALGTSVTFDAEGSYTLRLTADDTAATANDTLVIAVTQETNPPSNAVAFSQDFESSTIVADYVDSVSPDSGEFNDISADTNGGTWAINASGQLEHVRNGGNGSAAFQRFGLQDITFSRLEFELSVENTTGFTDLAILSLGNWTTAIANSSGGASVAKAFEMTVKGRGAGKYYLRLNGIAAPDLTTGTTPVSVVWYANMSGQTQTYTGPDNSTNTVVNDAGDLWVDNQLVLDDIARRTVYTASEISGFRFKSGTSQAVTMRFDDLQLIDQIIDEADDTLSNTLISEGLTGVTIGSNSSGSSRIILTNEWEVTGSGVGLSGTADNIYFEETGVEGDFMAIARVVDLQSNGLNPRAGLMVRESNNAGARMVAIATTPSTNYAVTSRTAVAGSATETTTTESYTYPDGWLMLERVGDMINVAVSSDGQSFTQVDNFTLSGLGAIVNVGLFSSSGSASENAIATFDDFELTISSAVFTQTFDSTTLVTDYYDAAAPTANQFNDISAEVDGGTWSINNGALQIVRSGLSGNDAGSGFMRYTDFPGTPNLLKIEYDLAIQNLNTFSDLAVLRIGDFASQRDYSTATPNVSTTYDMVIKGGGTGLFRFRINGVNTSTYAADGTFVRVTWYLNTSGVTQTYIGPDGNPYDVDHLSNSLWCDTTLLFDNTVRFANFSNSSLTDLYFRCTTSQPATFQFDNITISDSL